MKYDKTIIGSKNISIINKNKINCKVNIEDRIIMGNNKIKNIKNIELQDKWYDIKDNKKICPKTTPYILGDKLIFFALEGSKLDGLRIINKKPTKILNMLTL